MSEDCFDIDRVPVGAVRWPAAFRLRPASVPAKRLADRWGIDLAGIEELARLCSPTARHDQGVVRLPFEADISVPAAIRAAFAHPMPEWRLAPGDMPHVTVSATLSAALAVASELYGRFLQDTKQPACQLSFVLERYQMTGIFHDVTDMELYKAYYSSGEDRHAHQFIKALYDAKADGAIFSVGGSQSAIVLNPERLQGGARERAVALEWNGDVFTRYFDYRDLHWGALVG